MSECVRQAKRYSNVSKQKSGVLLEIKDRVKARVKVSMRQTAMERLIYDKV